MIGNCLLYYVLQIEVLGGQALTFGGDVSKEADVDSMIKTVSNCCSLFLSFYITCHVIMLILCYWDICRQLIHGELLMF